MSQSQAHARRLDSGGKDNPGAREEGPSGVKDVRHLSSLWAPSGAPMVSDDVKSLFCGIVATHLI